MSKSSSAVWALLSSVTVSFGALAIGFLLLPSFAGVISETKHTETLFLHSVGLHATFAICMCALALIGYEIWLKSRYEYDWQWKMRIFGINTLGFVTVWILSSDLPLPFVCATLVVTIAVPKVIAIES